MAADLPKAPKSLVITSAAFQSGQPIPSKYTCEGQDVSPPLNVANVPPTTKSLAIICDDPDAPRGTWLHWTVWNIPPTVSTIPEGVTQKERDHREGITDNRTVGYGGPCPPPGKPHRYFFKVYALNAVLELQKGASLNALESAMKGKILAWGELMGTFKR